MGTTFKRALARSARLFSAATAVVGVGVGVGREAEAVTINSAPSVSVFSSGGSCNIFGNYTYTTTTSDTGGASQLDYLHAAITDINGNPSPGIATTSGSSWLFATQAHPSSGSDSVNLILQTAPNSVAGDLYLSYFEATGSLPSERTGGPIAQVAIPQSALQAAGGACLNLLPNIAPTANAGPDATVTGGALVNLQGAASDPNNDPLTYTWSQTGGPSVSLSGGATLSPSFVAPAKSIAAQALTFSLVANDGSLSSTPDNVIITVAANVGPSASAGPDASVAGGALATLDASASTDGDGDPLTYSWTQMSGPSVGTLNGANTATPSFTAPPKDNVGAILSFQVTVSDGLATATDTVNIEVPPNAAPTADAGPDANATGGSAVTLDGAGSSDGDGDPITYAWNQTGGPTVALSNASTANPTFTAPPKTTSAQTLTFDLTVNDGLASQTDSVAITVPANGTPTANAGLDATVVPNSTVALDGSGSADPDGDPVAYTWTQVSGPTVSLTGANTANPGFTAPGVAAAAQTLEFALTVNDGLSNSSADTVVITIPANTAPVANAGANATSGQGSTVTLDGSGSSDVDNQALSYTWTQTSGPSVTLSNANTAAPSFVVPAVTSPTPLVFELVVNDGIASSAPQSVTITAVPNAPPVVNAGADQSADGGDGVTLSATASDPETDPMTFSWTQTAGPSVTLSGASTLTPSFTAPAKTTSAQTLTFEFAADDGSSTSTDSVDIIVAANIGPAADAGADATVTGAASVTLDGSGSSDGDGDPIAYAWTQISGPSVALSNSAVASPTFTAPPLAAAAQALVFQLAVDDGVASPATDTVTITIQANSLPNAIAGSTQSVSQNTTVTLDGSGSNDVDGQPLTYTWTQTAGPSVTLSNPTGANPTFTAPAVTAPTTLQFSLVVNDGIASSSANTVQINVLPNAPPVVNAGADTTAAAGSNVNLAGTATDAENDPLTYAWTQTAGPSVTLSGDTTLAPSFTAPPKTSAAQVLTFSLTANDGTSTSAPDIVNVTIPANLGVTANAGPDATIAPNTLATLDGSGSADGDGDALTYQWTQISGPSVTLSDPTVASPTFTAPPQTAVAQTFEFALRVSDGLSAPSSDTVTITLPANTGPIAVVAASQTVTGGATVTLDGSGSNDGDGDPLTFAWTQTGGPSVTLSDAAIANPTFTAPQGGAATQTLTFNLVVSDGIATATAATIVEVAPNAGPTADAGPDQGPIDSGRVITLDGSGSSDPNNDQLTYTWTQVSGTTVNLANASTAAPSFTAPTVSGEEDLVFQLIVSDGQINSAPDNVTITVRAVGTITLVQEVVGADRSFGFSSDAPGLTGDVTTVNGRGELLVATVPAGNYVVTADDLSAAGYALTAISCNDTDSAVNLSARSVAISLSPSEELVCTFSSADTRSAAQSAIRDFLTARNTAMLSLQPSLQRRLNRLEGQSSGSGSATAYNLPVPGASRLPFNLSVSDSDVTFATSLATAQSATGRAARGATPFDIWGEAYLSRLSYLEHEGEFALFYLGADYRVSDDLLVGVLAQYDRFQQTGAKSPGAAEGDGWMAGPYATIRLAPRLFADVRTAWGRSDNTVTPLGTYTDSFDTSRSLYSGSLIGRFELDKRTLVQPEVSLRYLRDEQESYVDSFDIYIPSQVVDQGELSFRPRLQRTWEVSDNWTLLSFGSVEGVYAFGAPGDSALSEEFRVRVEGGADLISVFGVRASISGFYDGLGVDDYENLGLRLSLSTGF